MVFGSAACPQHPISAFYDRKDLKRDYVYNVTLAQKFWQNWIEGYLPTLQGRSKWREIRQNLISGLLVLVADAKDICKRGTYRLGRIQSVHPQVRNGKEIVRRATVAVLKNSGSGEVELVLRDVSKLAPV